jgi:hypothetical protein
MPRNGPTVPNLEHDVPDPEILLAPLQSCVI